MTTGLPFEQLGAVEASVPLRVDGDDAAAYARATNDPDPRHRDGIAVAPMFVMRAMAPTVEALLRAALPSAGLQRLVHSHQDIYFARPLRIGDELLVLGAPHSYRGERMGGSYCMRVVATGAEDEDVVEALVTVFVRDFEGITDGGPDRPDHRLSREARTRELDTVVVPVDLDQPQRYAAASGDFNPIHLDPAVARTVGFPGVILHGACTMAMGVHAALGIAGTDGSALRRAAARFIRPAFPGDALAVTAYDGGTDEGRRSVLFDVVSNGKRVITDGRLELV